MIQFQPKWRPVTNHKLPERQYATPSNTPARVRLTSASGVTPGLAPCMSPNATEVAITAGTGPNRRWRTRKGYPRKRSSSVNAAPSRRTETFTPARTGAADAVHETHPGAARTRMAAPMIANPASTPEPSSARPGGPRLNPSADTGRPSMRTASSHVAAHAANSTGVTVHQSTDAVISVPARSAMPAATNPNTSPKAMKRPAKAVNRPAQAQPSGFTFIAAPRSARRRCPRPDTEWPSPARRHGPAWRRGAS